MALCNAIVRIVLGVSSGLLIACDSPNPFTYKSTPGTTRGPEPIQEPLPPQEPVFPPDLFIQQPARKVNILFIVDGSGSMVGKMKLLATNFGRFQEALESATVDYRIAIATPDPHSSWLLGGDFLTRDTIGQFANRIASFGNTPYECGIEAARVRLETNPTFLQEGARLVLIFISDEEDQRGDFHGTGLFPVTEGPPENYADLVLRDYGCEYPYPLGLEPTTENYAAIFKSIPGPAEVRAYAITHVALDSRDECHTPTDYAEIGPRYINLAYRLGGRSYDLCEPDWSPLMAELGLHAGGLDSCFELSIDPAKEGVEPSVTLNGAPTSAWQYQINPSGTVSICFPFIPEAGSEIVVTY